MSLAIDYSLSRKNPGAASEYTQRYFEEVQQIAARIDPAGVDRMVDLLIETREKGGRLFFPGGCDADGWDPRDCC